ncbi:hypothetical protein SLEP1_g44408 [Rubroshorea leprosula]|uniref:Uncharacterized protein n=1 Tax=Rubroshorea leprosula TaxID=152421 RepID=A0AAV5LG39_9ROSI|nr:hypothetical protein SLEP1_g44408 [Rubroshorea leprosula]
MARKVKRYGRANVSPQRSGQTRLIQKSLKIQIGQDSGRTNVSPQRFGQIVTRFIIDQDSCSSSRPRLPGRHEHANSFTIIDRLLKFPKNSAHRRLTCPKVQVAARVAAHDRSQSFSQINGPYCGRDRIASARYTPRGVDASTDELAKIANNTVVAMDISSPSRFQARARLFSYYPSARPSPRSAASC